MISTLPCSRKQPGVFGATFRRVTISVCIVILTSIECIFFVLHEWWLPVSGDYGRLMATSSSSMSMPIQHLDEILFSETVQEEDVINDSQQIPRQDTKQAQQALQIRAASVARQRPLDKPKPMATTKGADNLQSPARQVPSQQIIPNAKNKHQKSTHAKKNEKRVRKAKRQPTSTRGWDPGAQGQGKEPTPLKVGTPIFVASLPKSGTTSIWQYFNCGARYASHQWVKTNSSSSSSIRAGVCIRDNVAMKRPPFEGCGNYDVYSDTGFSFFVAQDVSDCYYPSISALSDIHQHYPNATIIMITRNSASWLRSMQAWGDGSLLKRWKNCNMTSFLPSGSQDDPDAFAAFYDWHTAHVRSFAKRHPSLTYVEVSLESPGVGHILEEQIGIPASCWGICTPYSKFCKPSS